MVTIGGFRHANHPPLRRTPHQAGAFASMGINSCYVVTTLAMSTGIKAQANARAAKYVELAKQDLFNALQLLDEGKLTEAQMTARAGRVNILWAIAAKTGAADITIAARLRDI